MPCGTAQSADQRLLGAVAKSCQALDILQDRLDDLVHATTPAGAKLHCDKSASAVKVKALSRTLTSVRSGASGRRS
eukprot:5596870-Prorocentrum_lima.AAC.1